MEKLVSAVKNWLAHIMPDVAYTLVSVLTPDVLADIAKETAVHGPYSVDIEELRGPITSIDFYVMVAEDTMLMAVAAIMRDAQENATPQLTFDMLFDVSDFAKTFTDEQHVQELVDKILEQFKNRQKI